MQAIVITIEMVSLVIFGKTILYTTHYKLGTDLSYSELILSIRLPKSFLVGFIVF